ncbi:hypothetical protein GW7_18943 [Heterocephalus glaber]|uniref:Uncharacterized protein n=1 Tax=Heterocephalus glaber TaxID=10181 RepID=G5BCH5_HETGA|nr:hypothetical protein GW7_18943 [Heterocephalus glaber]
MNHRTPPYPAGDYCLLCRSERKDSSSFLESGVKTSSKLALSMAPKGNSVLHLPLWVCPDCRRTVEKEERHGSLDQPPVGGDSCLVVLGYGFGVQVLTLPKKGMPGHSQVACAQQLWHCFLSLF